MSFSCIRVGVLVVGFMVPRVNVQSGVLLFEHASKLSTHESANFVLINPVKTHVDAMVVFLVFSVSASVVAGAAWAARPW